MLLLCAYIKVNKSFVSVHGFYNLFHHHNKSVMEGNRDEIEMLPHSASTPHTHHPPPNPTLTDTPNPILMDSPNPILAPNSSKEPRARELGTSSSPASEVTGPTTEPSPVVSSLNDSTIVESFIHDGGRHYRYVQNVVQTKRGLVCVAMV